VGKRVGEAGQEGGAMHMAAGAAAEPGPRWKCGLPLRVGAL
jgi:hypothetical protein